MAVRLKLHPFAMILISNGCKEVHERVEGPQIPSSRTFATVAAVLSS
jgi:hypothetical protein